MFEIVLYQPEIPPNTGNVMRLAANTGCRLHLVEPLGFSLEDRLLRRAGLDYREYAEVRVHADWASLRALMAGRTIHAMTTRGRRSLYAACFRPGDVLLFGPETRGLPQALLDELPPEQWLRLPMRPGSRSLNLSNAVAVAVYEAWRQNDFAGGV
ncbi:MAG: tRNA (cytidine(34)-2'-O)-methyltransferase [Thiobacillaceae bacterium]|nr:tRNA (cytidine(34)-2'-O)-methyltransferase [Thiobacillaceae bacterium]MCX7673513.1 tRNA (cytidine(34)-2'-O)-methyltransferase [Thiobacillaceae bacterium]MDW8324409.1 tRNA (cytidine(34)-2'-O)-methyltransferase [Burkholderiales bacterium]